jgi:Aminoglycoside-2''-adenylyltransferase
MVARWRDTTPEELRDWLSDTAVPWWIAGGWALDLWLGRSTRPHSDIEIGCFRPDLVAMLAPFADWEIAVARNKVLTPFTRGQPVPKPPFSLWLREADAPLWAVEVLVEERDGDRWVYRRDARITLPSDDLFVVTGAGWRVIAPEVQLLYKSKALRPKDEADFETALPHLENDRRQWLRHALALVDPRHPWVQRLPR